MDRRSVLKMGAAWGLAEGVFSLAGQAHRLLAAEVDRVVPVPIAEHVQALAQNLARGAYSKPLITLPDPFSRLTYDQYRDIRFKPERSIWRGEKLDFELQLFPIGFLYDIPVEVWIVDGDKARMLNADGQLFSVGPLVDSKAEAAPYAFSGFRIHGPLNRSDYYDEVVVFQGASYFRGVGRNQVYGMSARGLSINTARHEGEEFPLFRSFWIEKPKPGSGEMIVHALLDSPSTTGAYRFVIEPGVATVMDVDVTLYPRQAMAHVGIAPLTSMFLRGTANRRVNGDFRPSVHDSEGLALINGGGERLWRPLTNPRTLQTSAFLDENPKGFGLTQRDRAFVRFEDLEARYERRPSVWVEPKGAWGRGYVELIEIPAEEEIHDNIVAYWKPADPLASCKPHSFSYRLHWTPDVPVAWAGAQVRNTFVGATRKAETHIFVIDFEGPAAKGTAEMPQADVNVSAGRFTNLVVQRNPEIQGLRVSFELETGGTDLVELRLSLKSGGERISESWLYRWTRS